MAGGWKAQGLYALQRLASVILDGFVLGAGVFLFLQLSGMDPAARMTQVFESLMAIVYLTLLPAVWTGYTVGKRALRLKIMKQDHHDVGLGTMLLREVIGKAMIGTVTLGIAAVVSAFMVVFRKDRRAIHDLVAGTHVVERETTSS
ncbi:RDD family protein [Salsuginibacillus halophilus]|uniref:RDD family protein n=1 Tax=Salsuginibacillus halophilus TaxID=517424 RepID=A0A2P8HHY1_9BACI|nr:RDD family protein [Salsuginibacillus halophilus]PSL45835.1 RDD family protein [Salsuginibacillus halophilus]